MNNRNGYDSGYNSGFEAGKHYANSIRVPSSGSISTYVPGMGMMRTFLFAIYVLGFGVFWYGLQVFEMSFMWMLFAPFWPFLVIVYMIVAAVISGLDSIFHF